MLGERVGRTEVDGRLERVLECLERGQLVGLRGGRRGGQERDDEDQG